MSLGVGDGVSPGGFLPPNMQFHPTALSRRKIGGHTRFRGILWRRPIHVLAPPVKPSLCGKAI